MTSIRDTQEISERVFVKDMSAGLERALLPEPWIPYKASEDLSPILPQQHRTPSQRLSALASLAWLNLSAAMLREIGRGMFFLLFPVFMGIGAIVYFTLSFEPHWLPILAILTALGGVRVLSRRHFLSSRLLTLALALQLGVIAGKFETEWRATQLLGSEVATRITGRVEALEYKDNGSWRVTLDLIETQRPKLRYAPQRIRITV
ncbi:competence protein ComE [Brucella sp. TWI559]